MLITRRAYIRPIRGRTVEIQRKMATDAKCGVIYEHNEFGKSRPDMEARDLWVLSLRAGDEAWLPQLLVLIRTKAELGRTRVSADLAGVLAEIVGRGAVVVDGSDGLRSDSGKAWANRVQSTLQKAHLAHQSNGKISAALKRARAVKAKREGPGMVARWLSPAKSADRRQALITWQSRAFPNADEARKALPDELASASLPTLQRIFHEGRDPARKGMGGRPKVTKPKKLKTRR